MLADPGLVVAQLVEMLDQLQVTLQGQCWVLAHGMERSKEDPKTHSIVRHGPTPNSMLSMHPDISCSVASPHRRGGEASWTELAAYRIAGLETTISALRSDSP